MKPVDSTDLRAPEPPPDPASPSARGRLLEVILAFLKVGCTAFGGPAAHVAVMEAEFVSRRHWLDRGQFLDLYAMVNLVPGPNSSETAMHIGYVRAGIPGLIAAGVCFILPASLLTLLIAVLYEQFEVLPPFERAFRGIQPVVLVVVAGAVLRLGVDAVTGLSTGLAAAGAAALLVVAGSTWGAAHLPALVVGAPEIVIIVASAAFGLVFRRVRAPPADGPPAAHAPPGGSSPPSTPAGPTALLPLPLLGSAAGLTAAVGPFGMMCLNFLKTGALLFGSGYLLVNFLRADFVLREGRLSERELLDAVAVGQFTPGPILSAASFVGYRLHGVAGAAAATAAIFLPAFVIMLVLAGRFERLRSAPTLAAVLRGINPVVVGLLAGLLFQLTASAWLPASADGGRAADWFAVGSTALAAGLMLVVRLNPMWLLAPAALAGTAAYS
jgi:chromate transporter